MVDIGGQLSALSYSSWFIRNAFIHVSRDKIFKFLKRRHFSSENFLILIWNHYFIAVFLLDLWIQINVRSILTFLNTLPFTNEWVVYCFFPNSLTATETMSIHLLRTYRPALNSYAQAMVCSLLMLLSILILFFIHSTYASTNAHLLYSQRYNVFRTTESKRCMSFSRKFASKPAISWKSVLVAGTLTGAIVYWMRELKAEKERSKWYYF